jgi:hypothetical protein
MFVLLAFTLRSRHYPTWELGRCYVVFICVTGVAIVVQASKFAVPCLSSLCLSLPAPQICVQLELRMARRERRLPHVCPLVFIGSFSVRLPAHPFGLSSIAIISFFYLFFALRKRLTAPGGVFLMPDDGSHQEE